MEMGKQFGDAVRPRRVRARVELFLFCLRSALEFRLLEFVFFSFGLFAVPSSRLLEARSHLIHIQSPLGTTVAENDAGSESTRNSVVSVGSSSGSVLFAYRPPRGVG